MQTVTKPDERIKVGEQELEEVDLFCYLGSTIDQEVGTAADVKAQIGKVTCNIYITQKSRENRKYFSSYQLKNI